MNIPVNSVLSPQQVKQAPEETGRPNNSVSSDGFLSAAKKVFSVIAALPASDADKAAPGNFKKIKETNKPDKKRTEEDALHDIERLLRRVEKNKKSGRQNGSR